MMKVFILMKLKKIMFVYYVNKGEKIMGRSVNYLNNAETVIYFTADWINESEDSYLSQLNYEDFIMNLLCEIKSKLKSYTEVNNSWDNRETKIILENELCNIGISEYCRGWSLSVAIKEDIYSQYCKDNIAKNHAIKIQKTLEKCLENAGGKIMYKLGTFSNGNNVYRYKGGENE